MYSAAMSLSFGGVFIFTGIAAILILVLGGTVIGGIVAAIALLLVGVVLLFTGISYLKATKQMKSDS